jgi:hypothetical protein
MNLRKTIWIGRRTADNRKDGGRGWTDGGRVSHLLAVATYRTTRSPSSPVGQSSHSAPGHSEHRLHFPRQVLLCGNGCCCVGGRCSKGMAAAGNEIPLDLKINHPFPLAFLMQGMKKQDLCGLEIKRGRTMENFLKILCLLSMTLAQKWKPNKN